MNGKFRRILSLLTAIAMCFSLFPVTALAADGVEEEEGAANFTEIAETEPAPEQLVEPESVPEAEEEVFYGEAMLLAPEEGADEGTEEPLPIAAEPMMASAALTSAEEPEIVASGECGDNLTWTLDEDGLLTISGTGEMADYADDLSAPWYEYCRDITGAVIGAGVTSIGDNAFNGCDMTSITLPEGLTSIGDGAFANCSNLTSITIPASVTSIGGAFAFCSASIEIADGNESFSYFDGVLYDIAQTKLVYCPRSMKGIYTVPEGVTSIGNYAFCGCGLMTGIVLPESVTSIGEGAFFVCWELTSINLPEGVTSIGDLAFSNCGSLTSITIPANVTSIGNSAFQYCCAMTSITIPAGVTSIGDYAFAECNSLASIEVDSGNAMFSSLDGVLYNKDQTVLLRCPIGLTGTFTVPEGVTGIGDYAFGDCTGLTGITLPSSVTSIGVSAFSGCRSLTSITIPASVMSIGDWAFEGCTGLTGITLPASVTSIGYGAFAGCRSLSDVCFIGTQGQWDAIDIGALNDPLKSAAIHYHEHTFSSAWSSDDDCHWHAATCEHTSEVSDRAAHVWDEGVAISEPTVTANGEMLYTCTVCDATRTVILGECGDDLTWTLDENGLMTISGTGDMWDFTYDAKPWEEYINQIKSVVIGEGATSIGDYAFYHCSELTDVTIPEGVKSIGEHAFNYLYNLKSIKLPASLTSIGSHAFFDCYALADVEIPEDVKIIGEQAFSNDYNLTSITIPEGTTHIGWSAFAYCWGLTSITIPASMESIAEGAFFDCYALADVYYGGSENGWNLIYEDNGDLTDVRIHFAKENGYVIAAGECGDDLTWTLTDDGVLTISGTGDMWDYKDQYDEGADGCVPPWLDYVGITTVVIEEGVTSLGDWAFQDRINLTEFRIPESVTRIGEFALGYCSALTSVTIPEGVTRIGEYAFGYCTGLTSVTIPEGVESICEGAFDGCDNLTDVYFGGSETRWNDITIGSNNEPLTSAAIHYHEHTFSSAWSSDDDYHWHAATCEHTSEVSDRAAHVWDEGVVTTEPTFTDAGEAVYTCTVCEATKTEAVEKLHSISGTYGSNLTWTLTDDGVLTISGTGAMANRGSNSLWSSYYVTEVVIESGVTTIGDRAFQKCTDLTEVSIPDTVTSIGKSAFAGCTGLTTFVIPSGVQSFGAGVFADCTGLTELPEGLTSIGSSMFSGCTGLTEISIPVGVRAIGENAFYKCSSLTGVELPGTVNYIGNSAFYGCVLLSDIDLPMYMTSIGDYAFNNCKALADITLPRTLTSIGEYAFCSCKALTELTIPGTVTAIGDYAFSGCSGVTGVELLYGVETIGNYAFYSCEALTDIVIPDSVTTIGGFALCECKALTEVTIPDSVTSIGAEAFESSGLTSVTIPASVMTIETAAFQNCFSLTEAELPDTLISIGRNAFNGCNHLSDITIPGTVTSIGEGAFRRCIALAAINLPEGLTSIGKNAFTQCTALTEITIPGTVTTMGDRAFEQCTALTGAAFSEGVTNIGSYAFYNCTALMSVTIPASVTAIGDFAVYGCGSLTDVYYAGTEEDWEEIGIGVNNFPLNSAEIHCHVHTFSSEWSSDDDYHWHAATCEHTDAVSDKAAHDWAEVIITEATYLSAGEKQCTCTVCDATKTVTIPMREYNAVDGGQCGDHLTWALTEDGVLIIDGVGDMWDFVSDGTPWNAYLGEITAVEFGEDVMSIGDFAFAECTALTGVVIPAGVINLGVAAFSGCFRLKSLTVSPDNPIFHSAGNCVIETRTKILVCGCGESVIPADGSVTSIGAYAFDCCYGLLEVTIPDTVTAIGDAAFRSCGGLEDVTIPAGVTAIGDSTFEKCTALETVTISAGMTAIGDYAFYRCSELTDVYFLGSPTQWEAVSVGSHNDPLTDATLHCAYVASGECGDNFTWTLDEDGVLTISGTGEMADYADDLSAPWYEYRKDITKAVIGTGVTSIGDCAFYDCYALTDVTIPKGVTSIGDSAFLYCSALADVALPDTVTSIGANAFYACRALRGIHLPDDLSFLGEAAFGSCSALQSIAIPVGVTSIGEQTFANCSALTGMTVASGNPVYHSSGNCIIETDSKTLVIGCNGSVIPDDGSVTSIGSGAFKGSGLTSVTIPLSVTSIGGKAFSTCHYLTDVYYPGSPQQWDAITIGDANTSLLSSARHYGLAASGECGEDLTWKLDNDGLLTIEGTGEMRSFTSANAPWSVYSDSIITVEIAEGVTSIGNYAFYDCENLISITIPAGVTAIGDGAFDWCKSLTDIVLPEGLTSIGKRAFNDCIALTGIAIPASVTNLGEEMFNECIAVAAMTVAPGNTVYHSDGNCIIETASKTLLYGCKESVIPADGSVTAIGAYAFFRCSGLTGINIPEGVTSLGEEAFAECWRLASVAIPGSMTSLGKGAFMGCTALTGIVLPEGLTSIGEDAFNGCAELSSVTLPAGLTSIGAYAFRECSSLTGIAIPGSVTSIGEYAFAECVNLTGIVLPAGLTAIGERMFTDCAGLTDVEIPAGVTSIGTGAFSWCNRMTSVTIPASVTSIGSMAFYSCYGLTDVTFVGTQEQWDAITIGTNNAPLTDAELHFHEHTFVTEWSSNETYHWHAADCGHNAVADRAAHDWGGGTVISEATIEAEGEMAYTCAVCSAEKTEPIPRLAPLDTPAVTAANTTSGVKLSWTAVEGAESYEIRRQTENDEPTLLNTVTTLTCTDTTAENGVAYVYTVKAVSGDKESEQGAIAIVCLKTLSAPVIAAENTANGVQICWSQVSGATSYKIFRSEEDDDTYKRMNTVSGATTVYENKSAVDGKTYAYFVEAYNGSVRSRSNVVIIKRSAPLAAPVITVENTLTGIRIDWESVPGAISYKIFRAEAGSDTYKRMNTVGADVTSYENKSAVIGTEYDYFVEAHSAASVTISNVETVKRENLLEAPVITVENFASGIRIRWDAVDGATSYKIYRAEAGSGIYKRMNTVAADVTVYENLSPVLGKTYDYFVEALVGSLTAMSNVETIKRENPVTAPVITVENFESGIRIRWEAVPGATSIKVFRAEAGSDTYRRMNTLTGDATSYENLSPVLGKTYDYYVEAYFGTETARSNVETIKRETAMAAPVITAENFSDGIRLTWEAVPGATSYKIFRANAGSGTYKRMNTIAGDATSYENLSPVIGTDYDYYVEAVSGSATAKSNVVTIRRELPLEAPFITVGNTQTGVLIRWEAVPDATSYKIYRREVGSTAYKRMNTVTADTTSYENLSAEIGKTYEYCVDAIYAEGTARSNVATILRSVG